MFPQPPFAAKVEFFVTKVPVRHSRESFVLPIPYDMVSVNRYKLQNLERAGVFRMSKYTHVLFDLDGTLSDPKIGITRSVQYALKKLGIDEPDLDRLEPFIGPPLRDSFRQYYGLDEETVQLAIDYYRERFREVGMFENQLYPGIPSLLEELKNTGKILAVATSKPTVFAKPILKHFGIDSYFDRIVGANLDGTLEQKAEVIKTVLSQFPDVDPNRCLMVGDREYDIFGAITNHIDSVGVVYGYGGEEELRRAGATYLAYTVQDLRQLLLHDPCITRC
jgi:phosphoglycolate phosphatase